MSNALCYIRESSFTKRLEFSFRDFGQGADCMFPNPDDYRRALRRFCPVDYSLEDFWTDPEWVVAVQRHWHQGGQNGCTFAQVIANQGDLYPWHSLVINLPSSDPEVHRTVENTLRNQIETCPCDLFSLIFPSVGNAHDLAILVRDLLRVQGIHLGVEETRESYTGIGLRVSVRPDVDAWMVGFSPLPYFPLTRRSPYTEIVARLRPKGGKLFHRLNKDPRTAHLADVAMKLDEQGYENLWQKTRQSTDSLLRRELLHDLCRARLTVFIPTSEWRGENDAR